MTWKRVTSYIPACDGCGWECWTDIATAPEYATPLVGRLDLVERYEWRIERAPTGIRMECGDCAAKRDCESLGHVWAAPIVDPEDPLATLLPDHCCRCTVIRRVDQPEGDHPESMVLKLGHEDEALLARLDAELAPEEAA